MKKQKAIVVLNEQHFMSPQQASLLEGWYGEVEPCLIPARGLDQEGMGVVAEMLCEEQLRGVQIIFLSPIPALMVRVAWEAGYRTTEGAGGEYCPLVFANDRREKKELPGGKTISVIPEDGWYLTGGF